MANQKHLAKLEEGVESWNQWRCDNPDIKPDLGLASLCGTNLSWADFSKADFSAADLTGTDLSWTDLSWANLRKADLRKTDIRGAYLIVTDLSGANLSGANLSGTNLSVTNLIEANLSKANLRGTDLSGANLSKADLRDADLGGANFFKAKLEYIRIDRKTARQVPQHIRERFISKWFVMETDEDSIIRSIEFPPEYHHAGILILNHFGTVLRKKYPDTRAKIRIEQDGLKVTMIIDPVEKGDREIIESALDEYGRVVTGKTGPAEFFDNDPLQIMELETQLSIAKVQIQSQKRILEYQDREIRKQDDQIIKKDIQVDRLLELITVATKKPESQAEQLSGVKVFISYAKDDEMIANKLCNDLEASGTKPWIDTRDLLPGEIWKHGIRRAVRESDYFLALLSHNSVSQKGYVHKEQKIALNLLDEFPENEIFVIPVRIEACEPYNDKLGELHRVDLFPSYDDALKKILRVLGQKRYYSKS